MLQVLPQIGYLVGQWFQILKTDLGLRLSKELLTFYAGKHTQISALGATDIKRPCSWPLVSSAPKESESLSVVSSSLWTQGLYSPWNAPGQNTGVGSLSLLQFFPTQGLNPGLPHCRWILYQLSHKGSPRILEWVACPFSSGSSWPRNWTEVSCIAGRLFTNRAIREAHSVAVIHQQFI